MSVVRFPESFQLLGFKNNWVGEPDYDECWKWRRKGNAEGMELIKISAPLRSASPPQPLSPPPHPALCPPAKFSLILRVHGPWSMVSLCVFLSCWSSERQTQGHNHGRTTKWYISTLYNQPMIQILIAVNILLTKKGWKCDFWEGCKKPRWGRWRKI